MFHSKQDVDRHVNEVFRNIKSEYQRNSKCYQIAKLYYKFKDYKSAIKYINRYILTTTNSAAAHRLLGECYLGINLKLKAIDSFKTSLELYGSQNDLVLKICTLLMDPDVSTVTPRAAYWLERAETLFPTNPVVFQLREHLLKSNLDGKQDNGQIEKLILSEITARPTDVTVRIRLLNFFVDTKRYKIAYQHALEIEEKNTFSNDLRWYDCLCNVVQAYEKANNGLGFSFFIKKIIFFEKRADLSLQEFQEEVKTLPECSAALFSFDQNLHVVSKIEVPQEETYFFAEFMKHMRCQLSFHLATLALKRAKKEYGIWPKAFRTASPLLLQASQSTMDFEDAWYNMWVGKNKMEKEVKQLNRSANFRVSQAGHVLLSWSQSKGPKFLEKVSQFCGGKWQNHVYQDVFYNREHQQAMSTSHFINDSFFANVPMRLLNETELNHFDEVSQAAYPDSLHHVVWLGLAYCNANGYLNHDFRCTTVPDLQFTVSNLSQTGPETLNQLDVDAFLYASVLCAKSAIPNVVNSDRPSRLPVSISEELCSPAQAEWWVAVHKTYTNQTTENVADTRLKLRKGIEAIRVFGQHGLHVKVIVMLAKMFQERATKNKNPNELAGLENRAHLYWTAAIPLLEKMEKNQQIRDAPNRLFNYRGKDLTQSEIRGFLEDGRLFLACRLMKLGRHEQAIEAFQPLKSPYATFYQALIYEKLASEEVNHRPESITSENRSQHIILLTRARDALYLTLDRLRCPSVDPNHPLNAQLQDHLDEVEKQLAMIDPDSNLNRNGDSQSDETDTAPGPLSPDVDENLDSSFNVYNTSYFLNSKNNSTSRTLRQNLSEKHHSTRFEARPSPERLDAQLRHLVQANSNGLQAIVEQLKEMKSTMQIELKDLGCVTRDLLAEMKRWNDRLEAASKRATDVLKPEDLFELREEDYEDISQLSQPYAPAYQNYQLGRQMPGTQGTSTVPYGTPVPSPVPPVPPVIPAPENPLIPPAFYPGGHPVAPIDPSLLMYQSFGYYAPGVPYPGDSQNVPDYRGTGIQKGVPFAKNSMKAPDTVPVTTILSTKPQPPNVVITSSDTLPAFTSVGTPAMSVTVPPQHIRGLTPSSVGQKPSPGQVHPFQIQMPPQAQMVKESPTEKLNSLVPTSSFPTSAIQTALVSGVKPTPVEQTTTINKDMGLIKTQFTINKTPEGSALPEQKPESNKLFESRGTLSIFDRDWKEKGSVLVKVVHDDKLGKARIVINQDPGFLIHTDHYIAPDMTIESVPGNEHGWVWSASNAHQTGLKPTDVSGGKANWQKYRVKFKTMDESKDFEFAFNEGRRLAKGVQKTPPQKTPTPKDTKGKECSSCGTRVDGATKEKCSGCESKEKTSDKAQLGGFSFTSSPIVKPPTLKLNERTEKPKEQPKPSPFADFTFFGAKPDSQPKTTAAMPFEAHAVTGASPNTNWFAGVKADPNSFKKDANFKDFEGKDSLVFGYLSNKKTPTKPPQKAATPKSTKNEDEENGDDEFVPTAEFTPVVDLPDLVDVKTGEENDEVLYDERAKLLRFDTELKEWKERGVGNMRVLLNEETGRVRLIMRRELVLKVCCNHYLDEKMEIKRMTKSEKAVTWYAQDYSGGEIKGELFALKFAKPDSMMKFLTAITNAQSKMKNGRIESAKTKQPTEEKPKDSKPLSELFKPKKGSWECGTCLIRNDETATVCASCQTPKPGTEVTTNESTPNSGGLGKGITFPPSTTKFTFGIPPTTGATAPTTTSGSQFVFQMPQTTTSFVFGVPSTTDSATKTSSPGVQFKFGIPQTTATTTPNAAGSIFGGKPIFGASVAVSNSTPSFTTPVTSSVQVSASTTAPGLGWFTTGSQTKTSTTTSVSTPLFSFSTPNTGKTEGVTVFGGTPFTFNIAKTGENKSGASQFPLLSTALKPGEKEKFEFTPSNIKPMSANATSPKGKSPKKKGDGDGGSEESGDEPDEEDDDGDHIEVKPIVPLPDKVALHTGEEDEDVLYERRAKLYRFVEKEWKERGIGDIKILKHKTTHKLRLLMRRETILKVCLNHYLTPDIEFNPKDEKTWTWSSADFSDGEVRFDMFAIRFKMPEFAQEFKKAIEDAKNNVLPVLSKTETSEKAKEPTEAMKNFTFAVPNQSKPKSGKDGSDDDVVVVYENKVTPEQREKAISLQLPPNFYAYLKAPDCPGCPGCEKDDPPVQGQQTPDTANKLIFGGTKSWGKLSLGNEGVSEDKALFSFPGNQGAIKWNLDAIAAAPRVTQDEEEEDDDDEDDEENGEEEYEEGEEEEEEEEEDERVKVLHAEEYGYVHSNEDDDEDEEDED